MAVYKKTVIAILVFLVLGIFVYAIGYSYNREAKIAQTEKCNSMLEHPKPPVMMAGPGGNLVPVYMAELCVLAVTPPSLWNLIHGQILFENIPTRMKVNPYTLSDVLFGNYTFGLNMGSPCDQSATTTDCRTLLPSPVESKPYVPPNAVEPDEQWVSATNTPIKFSGFSFTLPVGWHGSVYKKAFAGGSHALVQKSLDVGGFVIDCPPEGKGFETATLLSSEKRSFASASTTYSVTLEKWTDTGIEPWYFLWIRALEPGDFNTDASSIACFASGHVTPDITEALQSLYQTLQ